MFHNIPGNVSTFFKCLYVKEVLGDTAFQEDKYSIVRSCNGGFQHKLRAIWHGDLDQRDWGCLLSFSFENPILATFSNEKKLQHHPYYPTAHPKNNPTILTVFLKTFLTKSCKCPPPKKRKKSERSGRRESIMHA